MHGSPNMTDPSSPNTDVIQGTLDLLILKTLSLEPLHGFGIARRVEQILAWCVQGQPRLAPAPR